MLYLSSHTIACCRHFLGLGLIKKNKFSSLFMEEAPTPLLESNQEQNAGKYSMCIVWSPIPFLTWLVPFIGHLGIGTTNGEINDFAGSYYIHVYFKFDIC